MDETSDYTAIDEETVPSLFDASRRGVKPFIICGKANSMLPGNTVLQSLMHQEIEGHMPAKSDSPMPINSEYV